MFERRRTRRQVRDFAEILEFARRCYDPQDDAHRRTGGGDGPGQFGGLIASGWHTGAIMMRLLTEVFVPPGNLASPGIDELRWVLPVRPGDVLSLRITVTDARRSRSKPDQGVVRSLVEVLNQKGETVMSLNPVSPDTLPPDKPGRHRAKIVD